MLLPLANNALDHPAQLAALLAAVVFLLPLSPVQAARGTDSYDGNIFALYAGDGALVPPG